MVLALDYTPFGGCSSMVEQRPSKPPAVGSSPAIPVRAVPILILKLFKDQTDTTASHL